MSTLSEIEAAAETLPPDQQEETTGLRGHMTGANMGEGREKTTNAQCLGWRLQTPLNWVN